MTKPISPWIVRRVFTIVEIVLVLLALFTMWVVVDAWSYLSVMTRFMFGIFMATMATATTIIHYARRQ